MIEVILKKEQDPALLGQLEQGKIYEILSVNEKDVNRMAQGDLVMILPGMSHDEIFNITRKKCSTFSHSNYSMTKVKRVFHVQSVILHCDNTEKP